MTKKRENNNKDANSRSGSSLRSTTSSRSSSYSARRSVSQKRSNTEYQTRSYSSSRQKNTNSSTRTKLDSNARSSSYATPKTRNVGAYNKTNSRSRNSRNAYSQKANNKRSSIYSTQNRSSYMSSDNNKSTRQKGSLAKSSQNENKAKGKNSVFSLIPVKAKAILILVLAIIVVGGVLDFTLNWGKIHSGVKVEGVLVGGMTVEEASTVISDALTPTVDDAEVVMYASAKAAELDGYEGLQDDIYNEENPQEKAPNADSEKKWEITQGTVGSYIDGEALANKAYEIGRSGWTLVFDRMLATLHLKSIDAEVSVSSSLMQDFESVVNKKIGEKVKEYSFKISGTDVKLVKGHNGWLIDQATFCQRLTQAIFGEDSAAYFLAPMKVVKIHINEQTANNVIEKVKSVITQPVNIVYGSKTWTLDSETLASFIKKEILEQNETLTIGAGSEKIVEKTEDTQEQYDVSYATDSSSGWVLQPYVNQEKANKYLAEILGDDAASGVKDASFKIKDEKVVIVKSKSGTGPNRDEATLKLQDILFASQTDRTITMVDTTIEPDFTTQDAQNMKITDKLSSWSITLGGNTARMNNIALLCKLINNSIIAPDETWSFNETTGERTEDKGFQAAPVIVDGKHEDQLGGGVCQVATCVFNAACYAGLGIESRVNHDFYISAYDDSGFADATVSWDEPDLKFVNDTGNYILLSAKYNGEETVTVSLWGTNDGRIVTCERGKWKEGAKWKTIKTEDDTLPKGTTKVEQNGQDGRSIKIHYLVKSKAGEVLHDIMFKSVYSAQNKIIRVGTKTTSSKSSK